MIVNLHTHTARCGHAVGEDEEYAYAAFENGIEVLGFSDHTPQLFPNGYVSYIRMLPAMLDDYVQSVQEIATLFKGKMDVLLGVEAEYYPACFDETLSMLQDKGITYMILGQHWIGSEDNEPYAGRETTDIQTLNRYCAQAITAMETGLFTYFAHPDLVRFVGDEKIYRQAMRSLCRAANATKTPLELNLLGLRNGRHYPNPVFWEVAAEENCPVVLGIDAHSPGEFAIEETEKQALDFIQTYGLRLITEPTVKRI